MRTRYHFINMGNKPLEFPVHGLHNTILIPAGTKYVEIAFRASHLTYRTSSGKIEHMNVYRWRGRIFYGW